jgi:hypothetical protein
MQKLLITFIWLIFSNNTFALDSFFNPTVARCNITYTKSYLNTGIKKDKYITTQFDLEFNPDGGWIIADPCYKGSKKLAKKMNKWMKKDPANNKILIVPKVNCKRRTPGIFSDSWSKYKACDELYRQRMINDWLNYPEQYNETKIRKE